jgi:hypothetical protein
MTDNTPIRRGAASRPGGALSLIPLLALLGARDIPTAVPQVEQRWIVPAPSTTIAASSLLPAGVSILPDSSGFAVTLQPITITRALSQDCSSCAAANGTTVAKPAFTVSASASTPLPSGLDTAIIAAGSLQVVVKNNYTFDPLRPSATSFGYAVVMITENGSIIGRDSVNGATVALPAGATLSRSIPLSGIVSAGQPVKVQVTLFSPAGDPVQMDASRTLVVTATPAGIQVTNPWIFVNAQQVISNNALDLSGIDAAITKRVDAGTLLLDVSNPFGVTGALTVQLSAASVPTITKSLALTSGVSHPSIAFTQAEIQQLLGRNLTLTMSGPLSSAGAIPVTPREAVVVTTDLDLTLHTGG